MSPGALLEAIWREAGETGPPPAVPAEALTLVAGVANGDRYRLRCYLKRLLMGDCVEHVIGQVEYRGRHYAVDRRTYIPDPESAALVECVIRRVGTFAEPFPVIAEIGVGCGCMGIGLVKDAPDIRYVGLDIDAHALEVARLNATRHGVILDLVESDLFDAWGGRPEPRLIFGDVPWGDADAIDQPARPLRHYLAMPPASAFPLGDRLGMHRAVLRAVRGRGWRSEIVLNCGSLGREAAALAQGLDATSIRIDAHPNGAAVLHCFVA